MSTTQFTEIAEKSILDTFNRQIYLGTQMVYSYVSTSAGSTEVPGLILTNPFQSGKNLFVSSLKLICSTASQTVIARAYFNPTVTGAGTPVTAVNLRPASTYASIATLASAPTVSGNGTLVASLNASQTRFDNSNLLQVLDQGQVLFITIQASAASVASTLQISWYEL